MVNVFASHADVISSPSTLTVIHLSSFIDGKFCTIYSLIQLSSSSSSSSFSFVYSRVSSLCHEEMAFALTFSRRKETNNQQKATINHVHVVTEVKKERLNNELNWIYSIAIAYHKWHSRTKRLMWLNELYIYNETIDIQMKCLSSLSLSPPPFSFLSILQSEYRFVHFLCHTLEWLSKVETEKKCREWVTGEN